MKEELKYVFANVNEWLKFAEAKHAGLIVFNSAIVVGVLSTFSNLAIYDRTCTIISIVMLGLSISFSLIAQFPVTTNVINRVEDVENPNIYFFGDLSKLTHERFVQQLSQLFPSYQLTESDHHLINQILINSKIVATKYYVFKLCCYGTVLSIGILGCSTVINILIR